MRGVRVKRTLPVKSLTGRAKVPKKVAIVKDWRSPRTGSKAGTTWGELRGVRSEILKVARLEVIRSMREPRVLSGCRADHRLLRDTEAVVPTKRRSAPQDAGAHTR